MRAWKKLKNGEKESFQELGVLTPGQYFDSLSSIEDIVELEEKTSGILPLGLEEKIKNVYDKLSDDLLKTIESVQLGDDKRLSTEQKAIIRIAEVRGLPKYTDALMKIICQLDNEKTERNTYEFIIGAMKGIGEPALEPLINFAENYGKVDELYANIMYTIADIASERESERVYRFLKDRFRKKRR